MKLNVHSLDKQKTLRFIAHTRSEQTQRLHNKQQRSNCLHNVHH